MIRRHEISKHVGRQMTDRQRYTHLDHFDDPEGVDGLDELMDQVADQLQSQMRAADQTIRRRAARLLSPSRTVQEERLRATDRRV